MCAFQDQSCRGGLMSVQYIKRYTTCDSPEWCSAEKSSSALKSAVSLFLLLCPVWPVAAPEASELCAAEVRTTVRPWAALSVKHTGMHPPPYVTPSPPTYGVKTWLSPRNAVAGVRVTVPRAVTRTAAVLMEPPVSRRAAVTAGASDTGLTSAFPAARVTKSAPP